MKKTHAPGLAYNESGEVIAGEYQLTNGVIYQVSSTPLSYTKDDLIARGWTFDAQGKPTPPQRA